MLVVMLSFKFANLLEVLTGPVITWSMSYSK